MQAQSDDADYEELVRRFERPLQQYALRIIGDAERARDVVQETFLQLYRSSRKQSDIAPVKWLFTVCRNRALNVCRKERRGELLDEAVAGEQRATDPSPDEPIEWKEAGDFLARIIATLPLRQQEVLQLKFQNDFSYDEIGGITGLSSNHVGVLIHNALKTLRRHYQKEAKDFIPFTSR